MKGKILKTSTLFLITVFSFFITSGCRSSEKPEITQEANKLQGTLEIWCSKDSEQILNYASKKFSSKNANVSFNIVALDKDDLKKKIEESNSTKSNMPDIIELNDSELESYSTKYKEYFTDLSGKLGSLKDKLVKWKVEQATYNDKLYAIPWSLNPRVAIYNKKLSNQFNIEPFDIKTWDEYVETADTVQRKSNGEIKMLPLDEDGKGGFYPLLLNEQNLTFYNEKGNLDLYNSKANSSFSLIKQLYDSKAVYDLKENENLYDVLSSDKVFSAVVDGATISKIIKDSELNKGKWIIENLPSFEIGAKNSACYQGRMLAVPNKTSINDASLEFIRYILTDTEFEVYALKENGVLSANKDFYYLPYVNSIMDSFNSERVWRFMGNTAMDCRAMKYGIDYNSLSSSVFEGEKKALFNGQDWKSIILDIQEKAKKDGY